MHDYGEELKKQMRFIAGSSRLFDEGNPHEAIRIANALEIVFNDDGKYKFLPDWLKHQNVQLISTCAQGIRKPGYILGSLVNIRLAPAAGLIEFAPSLETAIQSLTSYDNWWRRETILMANGMSITREKLVLWARNTDGGAHIQKHHRAYAALFDGHGWAINVDLDGQGTRNVTARHCHLAALRQIGFEVMSSPSIQRLWHPAWKPSHRIVIKPSDPCSPCQQWNLMVHKGEAFTSEEWANFRRPTWQVESDGRFRLIGEAPCVGNVTIESINRPVLGEATS